MHQRCIFHKIKNMMNHLPYRAGLVEAGRPQRRRVVRPKWSARGVDRNFKALFSPRSRWQSSLAHPSARVSSAPRQLRQSSPQPATARHSAAWTGSAGWVGGAPQAGRVWKAEGGIGSSWSIGISRPWCARPLSLCSLLLTSFAHSARSAQVEWAVHPTPSPL